MAAMQIYHELMPIAAPHGSAVALGFFDGVHLGHRNVLRAAVEWASENGCTAAAFTFRLPAGGMRRGGGRILSTPQKRARIAALGITDYLDPPFESFRALTPEEFVERVLAGCFGARAVFCGDNFTFGAKAAGTVPLLRTLCGQRDIAVHVVPMAQYGGETVSSTRIRAALTGGDIAAVNAMLGAPYAIDWPVTHGRGIGTSRLGTPTLNQNYPAGTAMPASGVYLTRIFLDGKWRPAATGIGPRPTVEGPGAAVTCETYVPDFTGDAYGKSPVLEFCQWYALVQKFNTIEELRALILTAAAASKALFGAENAEKV